MSKLLDEFCLAVGKDDKLIEYAQLEKFDVQVRAKSRSISQVVDEFLDDLTRPYKYIPFGFKALDELLDGGLEESTLCYVTGMAGTGKTALTVQACLNAAMQGKRVAICSMEMNGKQVMRRIVSQKTGIFSSQLKRKDLTEQQKDRIITATDRLRNLEVQFLEESYSVEEVFEEAERPELILVDYLQLFTEREGSTDLERISAISRKLQHGAKQTGAAIIAVSTLTRGPDGKIPTMKQLRGSGMLEHDADAIMVLWSDPDAVLVEKEHATDGGMPFLVEYVPVTVNVAKQRDGRTGKVELLFERELVRFDTGVD